MTRDHAHNPDPNVTAARVVLLCPTSTPKRLAS
jgi:hypothetical protein